MSGSRHPGFTFMRRSFVLQALILDSGAFGELWLNLDDGAGAI